VSNLEVKSVPTRRSSDLNLLLQVMDYGSLTDNNGRKADFRHVILIMTTNAGARELQKNSIGILAQNNTSDSKREIDRTFTPEFRDRKSTRLNSSHVKISY